MGAKNSTAASKAAQAPVPKSNAATAHSQTANSNIAPSPDLGSAAVHSLQRKLHLQAEGSAADQPSAWQQKPLEQRIAQLLRTDRDINELLRESELYEFCKRGNLEAATALLEQGVSANCFHPEFSWTPLHYASGYVRPAVAAATRNSEHQLL